MSADPSEHASEHASDHARHPIRVSVLRSRGVELAQTAGVALVFVLAIVAMARLLTPGLLVLMPVALMITIFYLMRRAGMPRAVLNEGALGFVNDQLTVSGKRLADRAEIQTGAVIPSSPDGPVVRLEKRFSHVDLAVADVDAGQAVLGKLGLDVAHAVAHFRVLSTSIADWRRSVTLLMALPLAMFVGLFAFDAVRAPVAIALLVPAIVVGALAVALPSRIVVGADGISGRLRLRPWFVSFDGVAEVRVREEQWFQAELLVVELLDKDGEVLHSLLVDQKKQGPFQEGVHAEVDARALALAERIREALELRDAPKRPFQRAALARDQRTPAQWVAHLRGVLERQATFRDAGPPTAEALIAIVEDASAAPADRAAAAVALSKAAPPIQRRVRIAADAAAEPKLRLALEAALEHDDEAAAVTLDAVDRRSFGEQS